MLKTIFTRILNTGSTNSVYINYQRASDKMWQYQVELRPGQLRNLLFVENTFETFFSNPTLEYIFYYPFPPDITKPIPDITPTPTPSNTNQPTPTPSNTNQPTPTPTPTHSPTLPTQNILDAILTNDGSYISVGDDEYLKYVDP